MPAAVIVPAVLLVGVLSFVAYAIWRSARRLRRAQFIRRYALPKGLFEKLRERRPELEMKDCSLVARGLRQFFLAYLNTGSKFVSMPSQVVDDLWHEFILYTREYKRFCDQAFGGFLHHSPAVVLGGLEMSNDGLRRAWYQACVEENINPHQATRLPLLFALDAKLNISNGFRYVPNCVPLRQSGDHAVHCAGDLLPVRASRSGRWTRDRGSCGAGCGGGHSSCGGGGCGGD
jgi:hypothetical protein